ncbi:RNA polymerase sigma factor SigJ [Actinomadura verrucosospora]|uniref:ECF subfamily RNA polymerase sigma-24 subunit n=1 Tax=Actinomadura verrucosospora TaxID=46165 RepID=A0A7D3ZQ60_ACTVE|nr:RNA polymerase sigma factor SigJ [Actinomadura verrucosospora]QKG26301.1 ECF subfamily RNA polymerase sigma-24 subunit [Actinomadura verrucosospora]
MGRLDDEWARHRPAVFGAAYRITGSVTDAEDIAQDVWLRAAARESLDDVRDLRAWLITVAARRAYDVLGSAHARRVDYVGPWLPEPLLTGPDAAEPVLVDENAGTAMLLVLEELSPPERVAFVLHQAFEVPYDAIAEVLGRTPAACRQLASRARRKVAAAAPPRPAAPGERDRVLRAFRAAYERRDEAALLALLDPDATYTTDGGGHVFAARKIIAGAGRVATALLRVALRQRFALVPAEVNGESALLVRNRAGRLAAVDTVEVRDGRIVAVRRVLNPEKLAAARSALGW